MGSVAMNQNGQLQRVIPATTRLAWLRSERPETGSRWGSIWTPPGREVCDEM